MPLLLIRVGLWGRRQGVPEGVEQNWFVGAPFPARAEPPRARAGFTGVSTPAGSTPPVWRWPGWRNYRVTWLRGRPSPTRGTPVWDEIVPVGCPRNWPWSRFHPRGNAHAQDRCEWDMNRIPCGPCPDSTDQGHYSRARPRVISPDDPVVTLRRNGTTGSRVGTRQRRSRPQRACPHVGDGCQRNHVIR
jgi:hypothetical protein